MAKIFSAKGRARAPEPSTIRAARRAVNALFFLNGALFATWASRLPAVQAAHQLNDGELGLALFAMTCGAMVAMPLAGALIGRIGSAKLCQSLALAYAAILPLLAVASTTFWLVLALFAFGATNGALDVSMNAQAVAVERRSSKQIMSSFHALWSTAGLIGAALGGYFAARDFSLRTHFAVIATILAGVAACFFRYLVEDEPPRSVGPVLPKRPGLAWPHRGLLVLALLALLVMLGEGAMGDWSAVYLHNVLGADESRAAVGYAAFSIAMATGRFSGDALSTRFGPVQLVRAGGVLAALGMLLALAFGSVAMALAGFVLVGLGFATIVPQIFSAAGRKGGSTPGLALASVSTLGYVGFLIGPPVIGFTAQWLGLRFALGLIVITSLAAAAFASVLAPASPPVARPQASGIGPVFPMPE